MKGSCRHVRYVDQGIADKLSVNHQFLGKNITKKWKAVKKGPVKVAPSLDATFVLGPQLLTPLKKAENWVFQSNEWGAQEKYDGKRIILDCRTEKAIALNRKGKECEIPSLVEKAAWGSLGPSGLGTKIGCVVDGELIGNHYVIFDLLVYCGKDFRNLSYKQRHAVLTGIGTLPPMKYQNETLWVAPLVTSTDAKLALFKQLHKDGREGIVFKKLSAQHFAGRNTDQYKYKFYKTISCITLGGTTKSSIRLGLYKSPKKTFDSWIFVGKCTIPQGTPIPTAGTVVEIKYLYAYKGGCLYQPSFLGVRDDVEADSLAQLKYKAEDEDDEPVGKTLKEVLVDTEQEPSDDEPKTIGQLKRRIQWK